MIGNRASTMRLLNRRGSGDGEAVEGPHALVGPFLGSGELVRRAQRVESIVDGRGKPVRAVDDALDPPRFFGVGQRVTRNPE